MTAEGLLSGAKGKPRGFRRFCWIAMVVPVGLSLLCSQVAWAQMGDYGGVPSGSPLDGGQSSQNQRGTSQDGPQRSTSTVVMPTTPIAPVTISGGIAQSPLGCALQCSART
ncbi:hypothetical protein KRR38_20690 [Novosphingobium sp. G106]|uniref:hypothetical protein n=1 Tax=Novosphingobium sp. G106 TaxID=2849500 RepID=UPI001C2D3F6D|nr:hypothetical protein [Novosphingobium sp. G106]MBV1690036.1 hypothetical protein [Novosphingobium sp. G106]